MVLGPRIGPLRAWQRRKAYAVLGLACLVVGTISAVTLLVYVGHEFSYDRHHTHAGHIFRVHWTSNPSQAAPLGPAAQAELPQVMAMTRMRSFHPQLVMGEESVPLSVTYADPGIFDVFSIDLISGVPGDLGHPYSMFLSEGAARTLFGTTDVMGRHLFWDGEYDYTVRGVYRDFPWATHVRPVALASFQDMAIGQNFSWLDLGDWNALYYRTYVRLHPTSDPVAAERGLEQLYAANAPRLIADHPETLLFFDSQGNDGHQLWQATRRHGLLANSSMIPGGLSRREMLTGAHLLIQPQALGRARGLTLQAMACGMPVLARQDPWLDYLLNDQTAWLAEQGDVETWGQLIHRSVEDAEAARELGSSARRWIADHHLASAHVQRTIDLYHRLISDPYKFTQESDIAMGRPRSGDHEDDV